MAGMGGGCGARRYREAEAMRTGRAPAVVIRRLPAYLRVLENLDPDETPIVSSQDLGRLTGSNPGQVRKDLTVFGVFGKQGVGYRTAALRAELRRILRLDEPIAAGLIGAGHLGQALTRYGLERERRFPGGPHLAAVFDADPHKIGRPLGSLVIRDVARLEETLAELSIKILLVAVPADQAQALVDRGINSGVKAFLNFAPIKLQVPEGVQLHTIDVGLELEALAYYA